MQKKSVLFVDDKLINLFDSNKHSSGGAAVQTSFWIEGFRDCGYAIKFTSPRKTINKDAIYIRSMTSGPKIIMWLFNTVRIFLIINKLKPSIIYLSTAGWKTIMWALISKITGAFYIQRISNNIVFQDKVYKKKLGIYKYILAKTGLMMADLVLCQNVVQKTNLVKFVSDSKIKTIYNPCNIPKNLVPKKNRSYIAWIGIFQYQKNLEALFSIAERLPDIQFKIAGRPYDEIDESTRHSIIKLEALSNVIFIGFLARNEISSFLSNAFCLLNTSYYEGFSNTYLEAFAVNTPVVTRRKTDPDGIIEKNSLGLVCDTYSELAPLLLKISSKNITENNFRSYLENNHQPKILVKRVIELVRNKI